MLAMPCFLLHATAGIMLQFLHFLKVLCLSFVRLMPIYALDPHISDHMVIMRVFSIRLLIRTIKYKPYSSNTVQSGTKLLDGFYCSLS